MAKLAHLVRIVHGPGAFRFEIDGEEFPWFVGADGMTVRVTPPGQGQDSPGVTFTLIADRVEVVDSLHQVAP